MIKLNLSPIQKPYSLHLNHRVSNKRNKRLHLVLSPKGLDTTLNMAGITNNGMTSKTANRMFDVIYN